MLTSRTQTVRFSVASGEAGVRLDQLIAQRVEQLSRRRARLLLAIGGVFVDGRRTKIANRRLRPGQVIELHLGGALQRASNSPARDTGMSTQLPGGSGQAQSQSQAQAQAQAQAGDHHPREDRDARYTIVFEDRDIAVVDKAAGLLSAPTPESDLGNLVALLSAREEHAVKVVHRLDLQTSGLLVYAKTDVANRGLSARFRVHDIERVYTAVTAGHWPADCVYIDRAIAGRHAKTRVRVVERVRDWATRLEIRLETGRTHQIRIHCRHVGHPVLGDGRYGGNAARYRIPGVPWRPPRVALHAAVLGFVHPRSGEPMRFESPLPADLQTWLSQLRAAGADNEDISHG